MRWAGNASSWRHNRRAINGWMKVIVLWPDSWFASHDACQKRLCLTYTVIIIVVYAGINAFALLVVIFLFHLRVANRLTYHHYHLCFYYCHLSSHHHIPTFILCCWSVTLLPHIYIYTVLPFLLPSPSPSLALFKPLLSCCFFSRYRIFLF